MKTNRQNLDEEELQILHDFERGVFETIPDLRAEKKKLEESSPDI
ncbi:MAG: hypothetical protein V1800_14260 [Candidatus Latescibacterota bacterium]